MGCPRLSQALTHAFLTRIKAGPQVQVHSLLRVGRPWELFQAFPPGDPFSSDSGGPSLLGSPTCPPAPWPVSPPAKLDALGVDSPWVPSPVMVEVCVLCDEDEGAVGVRAPLATTGKVLGV